jgi:hypothetical protein
MPTDSADSTRLKSDTTIDIYEKVSRWFTQICAAIIKPTRYFLQTKDRASDKKPAECSLDAAGAIDAATESLVANLTTTKSFTIPITASVNVDIDAQVDSAASTVLDQEEIKRRRDLVRTLFNDFWRAVDDKPAAFVERLDQAEDYLNERLAVKGELWRLDANTRTTLGLPRRSRSPR